MTSLTTECHLWRGGKFKSGYGRQGRNTYVHRRTWEEAHGPIPAGMEVMHTCNNKLCYALDHLALGTHTENMVDAWRDGLPPRGQACSWSKLTEDDVREIRSSPSSQRDLARRFGVSQATISEIHSGAKWGWL